ncbi:hypothetical protein HAV21_06430 [Paenarthrobacter sp. MSM-2-10-13]|uniref:hypothetical protein n=1 Tax=Micrococcaceae TaxID=1268 RepID=UPI00115C9DA7|nr:MULTISPECIES: hypothetical protein [Micrococcaceae]NHW46529.1 hypothetical protein [Paenarthrobacter sp. MSM-2-10-13]TQS94173.1 hypothetical protein EU811_03055 [Arthrobacter sp. TS-15]
MSLKPRAASPARPVSAASLIRRIRTIFPSTIRALGGTRADTPPAIPDDSGHSTPLTGGAPDHERFATKPLVPLAP